MQVDPHEMKNLAANRELVAAMNAGWEVNAQSMAP